ncbi:MAG: hypothetical protein JXA75_02470 [Candidatus Thermoplasmatota archaeon]|nr:hypothetical protein [Candidatus Thermoplasmatota archaeon]
MMQRRDVYTSFDEDILRLCQQPAGITRRVVEAVAQYNEMVTRSSLWENTEGNEIAIRAVEEEEAKVFLDGLFAIVQQRE